MLSLLLIIKPLEEKQPSDFVIDAKMIQALTTRKSKH